MAQTLHLKVLSPDSTILDVEQVKSVRARLRGDTWLSIYPGHAPLLAELLPGNLAYATGERRDEIDISTGILQVSKNQITVFVGKAQDLTAEKDDDSAVQFDNLARMLMRTMIEQKADHAEDSS